MGGVSVDIITWDDIFWQFVRLALPGMESRFGLLDLVEKRKKLGGY